MEIALWIAQGVLAVAFLLAGLMKLSQPKDKLHENLEWAEDLSVGQVRAIGALEALAAIGLIAPGATGIAPVLVPLAAVGIVLTMIGAIVTHVRRSEMRQVVLNVVFIAMAVFIAWGRFGDYAL